jgi:hypothetical protein
MRHSFGIRQRGARGARTTLRATNGLLVRPASHTSAGGFFFSTGAWLKGPGFRGTQILRGSLHSDSPSLLHESYKIYVLAIGSNRDSASTKITLFNFEGTS